MKIDTFKVERWMNDFEDDAVYNLGETCVDSLTIDQLLELSGMEGKEKDDFMLDLKDVRLTYGHIFGSPELVSGIAGLYKDIKPGQVVPSHGAIGANHQVLISLIEPDDNMVCVLPTYQQHYSIPASIGAEVRIHKLRPENNYLPDLDLLKQQVDKKTKMITLNNPNNPTGSWIPVEILEEIVKIAEEIGAYLLCDEVYRGLSEDGSYMHSVVDLYEKGISVGSMSKIFSLAGLRVGWIASRSEEVLNQCRNRRDYDTISLGALDDKLAALALANKDGIFARNIQIVKKNRQILDQWVRETEGMSYVKPVAGTTALVYYDNEIPSYDLCVRLIREKGVLVTPGSAFEMEGAVRIGYAFDSAQLKTGLDLFAELYREIKNR